MQSFIQQVDIDIDKLDFQTQLTLQILNATCVFTPGCWLAGGFPRQIAHSVLHIGKKRSINDYFRPPKGESHGDVDVFMVPGNEKNMPWIKSARKSCGGFAKEKEFINQINNTRATIQFIDDPHFQYDNIEVCLNNFDFMNCRYALEMKNDSCITLTYDLRAVHFDKLGLLQISKITSPFLGNRIVKYITERGCENGIEPDSYAQFHDWILNVACSNWPSNIEKMHLHGLHTMLKKLHNRELLSKEDIILFIGRWKDYVSKNSEYGSVKVEVDWATHNL